MQSTASHNKQRQPSEEPSPLASPPGHASNTKGKGSGSSVTVLDMIEAGLLQPGEQNTTVTYKGTTHTANLQRNGAIMFRGTEFTTPSAFSVYVKRLTTPNKQGDDGGGVTGAGQQTPGGAAAAKQQITPQQQQQQRRQGVKPAAGGPSSKAGPPGAQPGMRWVQCSRCEVWRSVAEDDWLQVESESGSTWFCEDATWELTRREPFTPACLSDLWTGAEGDEGPQ
eukprot:gene12647-12775_t